MMLRPISLIALLAGLAPLVSGQAATNAAGLSQLKNPKGLDEPVYRWNAEAVTVAERPPPDALLENDYATDVRKGAWDFDEGDTEGIVKFSEGIVNPRVADGKLKFTTGTNAYFYWGNHFDGDRNMPENIGANWPLPEFKKAGVTLQIRLRQSAPQSTWQAHMRANRVRDFGSVIVSNTEWQTICLGISRSFARDKCDPSRYVSLAIEPGAAGNEIEIDWIKLVAPQERLFIRKTLELSRNVRDAQICLLPFSAYTLYVNGTEVCAGQGSGERRHWRLVDAGKYFRKGKNVIAYEERCLWPDPKRVVPLALEGIVFFGDGTFERFATDKTWKGAAAFHADWQKPDFDDSTWRPVQSGKNVAETGMPGHTPGGFGMFIDPPYLGPIGIACDRRNPHIFEHTNGIALSIRLPATTENRYAASYSLVEASSRKEVTKGELKDWKHSGNEWVCPFQYRPGQPGVYDLVVEARRDGEILDRRIYELALVGKVPQREVPLDRVEAETKLELVDEIVCGDPNDPHPLLDGVHRSKTVTGNSRTGAKNDVRYRETGAKWGEWFSYRIKVKNVFVPHLIEVEYLDDRYCAFGARVTEKQRKFYSNAGNLVACRGEIGVYIGDTYSPATGKPQKVKFIYFSRDREATVDIVNILNKGVAPAIVGIKVYEIKDLPAVAVPHPSGRLIGAHTERSILILQNFYAGPETDMFSYEYATCLHEHHGFYRNWYSTFENQIRYMKNSGENLTYLGFWMYFQVYYPSRFEFMPDVNIPYQDRFDLMFDMFAANDLSIMPCFELRGTLSDKFTHSRRELFPNNKDIRNGAPTLSQVDKNGNSAWHVNPARPECRVEMAGMAAELVDFYGYSKAFAGLGLISGGWCNPMYYFNQGENLEDALDVSYDDYTMALFAKELKEKIPVAKDDPERFRKRYDWILEHARDQWIAFRCRMVADAHKTIRDAMIQRSPTARYCVFLCNAEGDPLVNDWNSGERSILETYRLLGHDPTLYKNEPNLMLGTFATAEQYAVNRGSAHGKTKSFTLSDEYNRLFDNGDNGAFFVRQGFAGEPWLKCPTGKKWLWENSFGCPVSYLGHRYFNANFAERLLQTTPGLITFAWQDVILNIGNQDLLRRFAVPFRSIPMGQYRNVAGNGLDRNMAIRETWDQGRHCFYVVNPYWWNVDVKLNLTDKTEVRDLVTDAVSETAALVFKLGAYQVKVFELKRQSPDSGSAAGAMALASAETTVDEEGRAHVKERLDLMREFVKETTPALMQRMRLKYTAEQFKKIIAEAEKCFNANDMAGALRRMDGYEALRAKDYIETKKKEGTAPPRSDYRVNLGCDREYKDHAGNVWLPDQDSRFGVRAYGFIGAEGGVVDRTLSSIVISNTPDPIIYATERYNFESYGFKVPKGIYTLKLHYVECYRLRAGYLEPGVLVNGKLSVEPFDLAAESGGFAKPLVKTVKDIVVGDGELVISFSTGKKGTRFSAIEVVRQ